MITVANRSYLAIVVAALAVSLSSAITLHAQTPPDWVEHLPTLMPLFHGVIWLVVKIIGGLALVIWSLVYMIFRKWRKESRDDRRAVRQDIATLIHRQNLMLGIMEECDGCSVAAVKYGKRKDDFKVLDGENLQGPDSAVRSWP